MRAQEFLAQNRIETTLTADAKKNPLNRAEALKFAAKATDIYAAKGQQIVHLRLKDLPGEGELAAAIVGPSGNLRAPAALVGKTLLVGFSEALYAGHFKDQ